MAKKSTIETEEIQWFYGFDQKIYKVLDDKSLFQDAVESFVHAMTVIGHFTIVSPILFNKVPNGLVFQAHIVPRISLNDAQYDETLVLED